MQIIKITFLMIVAIIVIIIALVFVLRRYNDNKYGNKGLTTYEYYKNVTDINLYPKTIKGVDIKYVDEGSFQGFHLTPHNKLYKGVVVCYGGSEGGPNFEKAERLAKEGYETLAVFMFGMKNQPKTLIRIPLEQFEDVLEYINKTIKSKKPITVLGASKGAEYALHLATKYEEISNLILIAPSAYTFAGLDSNEYGSSWTYKNKELPFIDMKKSSFLAFIKNIIIPTLVKSPIQYKESYASAVKQDLENHVKLIPVENVEANILMIVGEDDEMWGSYEMANIIKRENKKAVIASYKNAGHIFAGEGVLNTAYMRIKTGGDLESNEKAGRESDKIIDDFLLRHHKMQMQIEKEVL